MVSVVVVIKVSTYKGHNTVLPLGKYSDFLKKLIYLPFRQLQQPI